MRQAAGWRGGRLQRRSTGGRGRLRGQRRSPVEPADGVGSAAARRRPAAATLTVTPHGIGGRPARLHVSGRHTPPGVTEPRRVDGDSCPEFSPDSCGRSGCVVISLSMLSTGKRRRYLPHTFIPYTYKTDSSLRERRIKQVTQYVYGQLFCCHGHGRNVSGHA